MKRSGFTLLELLIVIVIISIIALITIPALMRARNMSNTFDRVAFASPSYYEENGRGYFQVNVFKDSVSKALTLPIDLIEVKVQSGQNGDTLSTVFDGGWKSVTIWVSSEDGKKEWDDFLNQARQREKEYQETQKEQNPRTPRRVPPPKI